MNKISSYKTYVVFLSASIMLTTSLFTSVNGLDSTQKINTSLNLNEKQIISIVEQKLNLLDKKEYTFDTLIPYSIETNNNPLFYIVSLKPIGFMIITTDYTLPPVLGYSFTSSITTGSEEFNTFTTFIKTDLEARLLESNKLDAQGLFTDQWQVLLSNNLPIQSNSLVEQWPPEGYSDTEGWIETQWHQNSPFNDLCPIDLDSGERGVAGCPAVAMAQILNYHKTINDVSFNDSDDYTHNYGQRFRIDDDHETYGFPSFPELDDYLDTIQTHFDQDTPLTDTDKAALIFACGTAATQVYSPQGSGTFGVSQAFDAYEKFNCQQIELLTSEDQDLYDRIIQNIKTGLPVHLAIVNEAWNSGHNLIIDGYNTNDYYHLNFGWSGSYDGWFDLPDELPFELTVIEGAIVDILVPTDTADLTATGSIQLTDVTPGSQVNGSFSIQNSGESDSELSWEIESYPTDWGTWEFSQEQGTGLTPEDGQITIDVTIIAPSEKSKTFTGGIKIINSNSPADFEVIPLSITTPKTKQWPLLSFWMNLLRENHPLFFQFLEEVIP
jgi:hypothetical protein